MKSMILFFAIITLFTSYVFAANPHHLCKENQIEIHELALDAPGMPQTNSLYGIINVSKTACYLSGELSVSAINKNNANKRAYIEYLNDFESAKVQPVLVTPLTNKYTITADKLVWFALHANSASDGLLEKLNVKFPEFDKAVAISYSGDNTNIVLSTKLQKGNLSRWIAFSSDSCNYPDSTQRIDKHLLKASNKHPVKIYFNKKMACG